MSNVPFNEVDMMVIAGLAYMYIEDPPGGKRNYRSDGTAIAPYSLKDMLEDKNVRQSLEKTVGKEAVNDFVNKLGDQEYHIVKSVSDEHGSGFAAVAIEGPDKGTVTVAARGTEGFSFDYDSARDVETDIQLGFSREADQQRQMSEFMTGLDDYDSVYLSGHSLGGNLAVHGAVTFDNPEKIKGVYTYNAPGQNAAYITTNYSEITDVADKITNYQTDGDVVSDINFPIGHVQSVKMNDKDTNSHLLPRFDYENGSFKQGNGKNWGHKLFGLGITFVTTGLSTFALVTGLDKMVQVGEDLISGIGNWLNDLSGGKLGELVENVYNFARDGLVNFVDGVIDFGKAAWDKTKKIYNDTKEAIGKTIDEIKSGVKAVGDGIKKGIKAVGDGIANAYEYITGTGRYNTDLIFVNTDGLNDDAKKMRAYQQEYTNLMQKVTNLIITLKQNNIWDTPATETFINSYMEIKELFDKFGRVMTEYSAMLEGVSERMQSTDNAMSAKFENLTL